MAKEVSDSEVQPVLKRIAVKSVCLHGPFFMEGVNYGDKLGTKDVKTAKPLHLEWSKEWDGIVAIDYNRRAASVIPRQAIASFVPLDPSDVGVDFPPPKPAVATKPQAPQNTEPVRAQYLNPMTGPAPVPRNPAQVENPTQPKAGRTKNAA
jgi:hypothetical protein